MKTSQELIDQVRAMIADARKQPEPSPEVEEQLSVLSIVSTQSIVIGAAEQGSDFAHLTDISLAYIRTAYEIGRQQGRNKNALGTSQGDGSAQSRGIPAENGS